MSVAIFAVIPETDDDPEGDGDDYKYDSIAGEDEDEDEDESLFYRTRVLGLYPTKDD